MNINKKWLKEENGDYIAPKTLTSCIQDEDGNSFQEYADNMVVMSPEETTEVPEDLTSCISNQDMYNIVSDAYDSTKTYAVGDYCIYNNIAYKCTTAIDTAEEFDSAKWTAIRIGTEVSELNSNLDKLGSYESIAEVTESTDWVLIELEKGKISDFRLLNFYITNSEGIMINSNTVPKNFFIARNTPTSYIRTESGDVFGQAFYADDTHIYMYASQNTTLRVIGIY